MVCSKPNIMNVDSNNSWDLERSRRANRLLSTGGTPAAVVTSALLSDRTSRSSERMAAPERPDSVSVARVHPKASVSFSQHESYGCFRTSGSGVFEDVRRLDVRLLVGCSLGRCSWERTFLTVCPRRSYNPWRPSRRPCKRSVSVVTSDAKAWAALDADQVFHVFDVASPRNVPRLASTFA